MRPVVVQIKKVYKTMHQIVVINKYGFNTCLGGERAPHIEQTWAKLGPEGDALQTLS